MLLATGLPFASRAVVLRLTYFLLQGGHLLPGVFSGSNLFLLQGCRLLAGLLL